MQADTQTDAPAGTLIKTTLTDFPALVSCAVFLCGCNLRCPYCHNAGAVTGELPADESVSLEKILTHLEKRKNVLKGIVLSGGEALLNWRTPIIMERARSLGYKIKLDTNGTLPEKLQGLLESPDLRPDYVSLDIKCPGKRLGILGVGEDERERMQSRIEESSRLIAEFLPARSREWRTVLVPGLIDIDTIKDTAEIIPPAHRHDARWYLADFVPGGCLDPAYDSVTAYSHDEAMAILGEAKRIVPGALLR